MRGFCISILWSVSVCMLEGSPYRPDVRGIAEALGYPESRLIVTDMTRTERENYERPSRKERRLGMNPPFAPDRVLAAWKMESTEPGSFLPMMVSVYQKNTLEVDLTETRLLEKGADGDGATITSYLGFIRSASNLEGFPDPHETLAIYSVVRSDVSDVDILTAFLPALHQGDALVKVDGGERYHEWLTAGQMDVMDLMKKAGPKVIDLGAHVSKTISVEKFVNDKAVKPREPHDGEALEQTEDGVKPGETRSEGIRYALVIVLCGCGILLLTVLVYRKGYLMR